MQHRTYEVFVPGRVCLFGEHSDWAGGYRRINSQLPPGKVIITGTNQGVHARVRSHDTRLIVRSRLPDGQHTLDLPMNRQALFEVAEEGGFFSYAAGVAYYMLTMYRVKGLEVDNYQTDLPVKKGLSSSAAFSVLVARAFNRTYDLKLTTRAEMEAAYQGEILTPSRCGRMDQGCAYGQNPILMTFNGDLLHTNRLAIGGRFHLLIADLMGRKDTIKILADLNRAYPFATDEQSQAIQSYLGQINTTLVEQATKLIEQGDAEQLGRLMTQAQAEFDSHLQPACPEELTSPLLHKVLEDPAVSNLAWGGKGVGSQGDGCVQLVAKGVDERDRLAAYLLETYGMPSYPLDFQAPQRVRKAVIPIAGFGTRMFPASKAIKKELFPIVTPDGMAKPIILAIVEEAVNSGIEEIALIVREGDETFYDDFFNGMVSPDHYSHLSKDHLDCLRHLQQLGERLTFIAQTEQLGFGHAVWCAKEWVNDEPFLLMLGDHLYLSDTETTCTSQLIAAYEEQGARRSVVGLYVAPKQDVVHYGTVAGEFLDQDQRLIEVRKFKEKPSVEYAQQYLVTPGLRDREFLCIYGQYILAPQIFDVLERQIAADARDSGEFQLTTALETLRKDEGILGYRVAGNHYDTGLPQPYVHTLNAVFARSQGRTV